MRRVATRWRCTPHQARTKATRPKVGSASRGSSPPGPPPSLASTGRGGHTPCGQGQPPCPRSRARSHIHAQPLGIQSLPTCPWPLGLDPLRSQPGMLRPPGWHPGLCSENHLPITLLVPPAWKYLCLCLYFRTHLPKQNSQPPLPCSAAGRDDKDALAQRPEVGRGMGFWGPSGLEAPSERRTRDPPRPSWAKSSFGHKSP